MIDKPFQTLVEDLAARTPTPGGGAAAAMTAAQGTALLLMVTRFTRGKKATAGRDAELAAVEEFLAGHLQRILPMAERDCASFDRVSAAYALAKETDEQKAVRARAVEEALAGAIVVPEELIFVIRDVLAKFESVSNLVGKAIVSDLGSGAELLRAAATCAWWNVRVNAAYLSDKGRAHATELRIKAVFDELERHYGVLRGTVDRLFG